MPNVAATLVWQWLFQPGYGVVNWLLTQLGVFGDLSQHDWFSGSFSAFCVIWLLVVWQSVPFVALTLRAGLSQIPALLLRDRLARRSRNVDLVPRRHPAVPAARSCCW
jgi:ABC-type sugar transport system permease subunit